MFSQLIRFSILNRWLVVAAAVGLLLWGGYTATQIPVDVFPDLTAPTVVILTEAHGMTPTDVETQITFPLETAMNGAAGVRRVRSSSTLGFSVVWVEFDWDTRVQFARQTVTERLQTVAPQLPPEADRPVMAPQSSILGEMMIVGLTSNRHSLFELRTVAETTLRRRLLAVQGVAQVTPIGGELKQYQAILRPSRLYAANLTSQQVADALRRSNENVTGGILAEAGQEYLVQGLGRVQNLDDLRSVVVAVREGQPIHVGDIAHVQFGPALKRGVASVNGQPAVVIPVLKQPHINTQKLTARLLATLEQTQAGLPEGMQIETRIFRQADFIETSISNVQRALRDGGILVVVIVILFLGNFRASAITLTAIPLSLVTTVLVLRAFGATINTMTLGGMAIAIGELVDDAIVDVENVYRRLRENARLPGEQQRSAFSVILSASLEIRSSIVFATMIVVLVFLPLFFLPGIEGRLLQPLGVAYIVSMLASLLVAVTVTPALCRVLLPGDRSLKKEHEPLLARGAKWLYRPVLDFVLGRPLLVGGVALLLLIVAVACIPFMGRGFLPEFDEGALTITAATVPGTSLEKSSQLGAEVERILTAQPEVVAVARQTGRAELAEHTQGVEVSELTLTLDMHRPAEQGQPARTKEELLAHLRSELGQVPGMLIEIGQPISHRIDHMLSGTQAAIAVKIFAPEGDRASLLKLRRLARMIESQMRPIDGVVDLTVEQQTHVPSLAVRFRRDAMARHHLNVGDVAEELKRAFAGERVSEVLEGRNPFDMVVRLAEPTKFAEADVRRLLIATPTGARIPLAEVAQIRRDRTPNAISREDVQRKIVVSCNVAGRDVVSVVEDIKAAVADNVPLGRGQYGGYFAEYGGQFESAESSTRIILILGGGVILLIGIILHAAFGSARDALLVLLNLPLALIGGVFGVFLGGGVLSVASLVGFITLLGIATRNGIMLVSHIRHLQRYEGETTLRGAVHRGAIERLSPILMTALSTGLGLLPLALAGGHPGSEIETPLAIVVLSGLLSSTLLNMIVVPALFLRFAAPQPPAVEKESL